MQTVVETPTYLKAAEKLFSAAEREGIVAMVSFNPQCGDVIQGTADFARSGSDVAAWESAAGRG